MPKNMGLDTKTKHQASTGEKLFCGENRSKTFCCDHMIKLACLAHSSIFLHQFGISRHTEGIIVIGENVNCPCIATFCLAHANLVQIC